LSHHPNNVKVGNPEAIHMSRQTREIQALAGSRIRKLSYQFRAIADPLLRTPSRTPSDSWWEGRLMPWVNFARTLETALPPASYDSLATEEAVSGRDSPRVAVRLNAPARMVEAEEAIALLARAFHQPE